MVDRLFRTGLPFLLVIGMALLRDRSIEEVVHHLDLVLPDTRDVGWRRDVSDGAVAEARKRLGSGALAVLFTESAARWAGEAADTYRWRDLAAPGVLPKRLEQLHRDVGLLVLPKRRDRTYPRAVKIKMSGYSKNPPPKHPSALKNPLN